MFRALADAKRGKFGVSSYFYTAPHGSKGHLLEENFVENVARRKLKDFEFRHGKFDF